jgi:hypothetical protein
MPLIPKLPAAAFFACSLVACGTSPGTFDGAVGPDAGTDEVGASETGADDVVDAVAPRPPTPGACARFDEISATAVNGPFEVGGISRSVSGTCFDPLESTDETWDGIWTIAVPPRSAVEVTARYDGGGSPSWGISAATPCAESTAVDCRWGSEIYERSQEGVRATYLANTSDEWEFWLVRAVFFATGTPLEGDLELDAVSVALDPAAGCDNALPL